MYLRLRSFKSYRSGELRERMYGNTSVGSYSEAYFCIYEKDYIVQEKWYSHLYLHKNRFEIRLKMSVPGYAVRDYSSMTTRACTAFKNYQSVYPLF